MNANPLFWLHFRFTGAWRNNVAIVVAYAGLVALLATLFYRLTPPAESGRVSSGCLILVTVLQGVFLLLMAPGAIRRAVLRDFQTGMIESHRLSPMSNVKIIAGYMTGPPVQTLWLWGTGLLLGSYFAADYARQLTWLVLPEWYTFQLCLLCLALMVAALSLLVALSTSGKTNVIGVVLLMCVFGGLVGVRFVPGLALVVGLLSGGALLEVVFGGGPPGVSGDARSVVLTLSVQTALAVVFLWAACRKVRAPDRAMFGMALGLLLTLIWGAALVFGMAAMPSGHWLLRDYENIASAQLVASAATFVLVALFPLAGAAVGRFQLDRAAAFGAAVRPRRDRAALLMPVVLGVLCMLVFQLMYSFLDNTYKLPVPISGGELLSPAIVEAFSRWDLALTMLAACLLSFWIDYNVLYFALARGLRVFRWLVSCVLLLKGLPLAIDLVAVVLLEEIGRPTRLVDMYCAGFSPIGTLILCLSDGGKPWPGLVGQVVLAAVATRLGWRARRALFAAAPRSRRESAPADRA